MEAAVSFKEVAIPDAIVSGRAGTGDEYLSAAGISETCTGEIPGRGFLGEAGACPPRTRGPVSRVKVSRDTEEDPARWYGDPAFPLTGGLEQISVRLDKKIDRQGRRLSRIEGRGRS
jgi:hypothetical protein